MAAGLCWMCGGPSETSEHRIKKTDLVHRFGRGPYEGDNTLVHVKEDRVRNVQGPDSKLVKYEKNLCANCNNTRTQPFDKAYEEFIQYVDQTEESILNRRVVDFQDVYGAAWEDKQRNLFKFFAKCFGCRLDEAGCLVPTDVVALFDQVTFLTELYVTFQVNEDQLLLDREDQAIGTHQLLAHSNRNTGEQTGFQCGGFYRWLTMICHYNAFPLEPVGAPWVANAKYLYLGWSKPLSDQQRSELIAKLEENRAKKLLNK